LQTTNCEKVQEGGGQMTTAKKGKRARRLKKKRKGGKSQNKGKKHYNRVHGVKGKALVGFVYKTRGADVFGCGRQVPKKKKKVYTNQPPNHNEGGGMGQAEVFCNRGHPDGDADQRKYSWGNTLGRIYEARFSPKKELNVWKVGRPPSNKKC